MINDGRVIREDVMRRLTAALAAFVLVLLTSTSGQAQGAYPNRPVRLISPFDVASTTDIVGRILAEHLRSKLGQPVVVENKPGAGGILGLQTFIDAPSDGYTLILAPMQPAIFNDLTQPDKVPKPWPQATVPVARITDATFVLVAAAKDFPPRTFKEMVEYAKANQGKVRYAMGGGNGSYAHLWAGKLEQLHGVKMVNIPLAAGAGKVLPMFLAGDAHLGVVTTAVALPLIGDPGIVAIAAGAPQRLDGLPNLPTYAEAGFPEMNLPFWTALWAPIGMPKDALEKLRAATNAALATPELQTAYKKVHLLAAPVMTAEATTRFFDEERESWGKLIRSLGLAKN